MGWGEEERERGADPFIRGQQRSFPRPRQHLWPYLTLNLSMNSTVTQTFTEPPVPFFHASWLFYMKQLPFGLFMQCPDTFESERNTVNYYAWKRCINWDLSRPARISWSPHLCSPLLQYSLTPSKHSFWAPVSSWYLILSFLHDFFLNTSKMYFISPTRFLTSA